MGGGNQMMGAQGGMMRPGGQQMFMGQQPQQMNPMQQQMGFQQVNFLLITLETLEFVHGFVRCIGLGDND